MIRCWKSQKISTITIVFFELIFLVNPPRIAADQGNNEKIEFRWSFGALVGSGHEQRLISILKDTVLHTGDRIKFFIDPQSECFIYLFHQSSKGKLVQLLPSTLSTPHFLPGTKYYIPDGSSWFKLDEVTGSENFFLLASAKRLERLELLYRNYIKSSEKVEIEKYSQSILTEIKNLKHQNITLSAAAERPLRLGGNFRNIQEDEKDIFLDVSQIAIEIQALNFYSRTFTIDHQ